MATYTCLYGWEINTCFVHVRLTLNDAKNDSRKTIFMSNTLQAGKRVYPLEKGHPSPHAITYITFLFWLTGSKVSNDGCNALVV